MIPISRIFREHVWKLVFRALLLIAALVLFVADRERLDFTALFQLGFRGVFLLIVWITLVFEMAYRLFPNRRIAIGARKHYARSYSAPIDVIQATKEMFKRLHKGAFLSIIFWSVTSASILLALYFLGWLTPPTVLIFVLTYAVLDLVFILFFCPFQKFFMKNRCCVDCRIYNWDYFMMCAPMLLAPSIFSISLVLLSAAVLVRWEIALLRKPHYFMEETNENLTCKLCEDKFCRLRTSDE